MGGITKEHSIMAYRMATVDSSTQTETTIRDRYVLGGAMAKAATAQGELSSADSSRTTHYMEKAKKKGRISISKEPMNTECGNMELLNTAVVCMKEDLKTMSFRGKEFSQLSRASTWGSLGMGCSMDMDSLFGKMETNTEEIIGEDSRRGMESFLTLKITR